ncbi:proteasome subunit alpha type-1-like [Schistocerca gregaria]|uniref:proteasome subunit alpha type-1-like n=1 Tax=Schistocerca gregaria TaxID=7010 RepID=UPI00211DA4FA|nr:proteasome subunit alpha type-1-like [Schistocerca gregaria]
MYKSQYDDSILLWSPEGRIHQVEYAMETVNMGTANVGLKTASYAVLCSLQRATSVLASHQKKIFEIDSRCGVAISGLTTDARIIIKWMRNEMLNHRYIYEAPLPTQALVTKLLNKSQINTQRYGRRPYGVGLLIASYDKTGTHIYETCPSGAMYDWRAQSIGARCQSARTYLENNIDSIESSSRDELILHALRALRDTLNFNQTSESQKNNEPTELNVKNCVIGIVGVDEKFHLLDEQELGSFLVQLEARGNNSDRTTRMEMTDI